MELQSSPRFRRRTNSSVLSADPLPVSHVQEGTPQPDEPSVPSAVECARFRRASFALFGERPTALDDLVDLASLHAVSAAATREAATIKAIVSPTSELADGLDVVNIHDPTASQRESSTTTVPNLSTSVLPPSTRTEVGSSPKIMRLSNTASQPQKLSDDERQQHIGFVWYNTKSFPSNPLTSQLVLKYLASMAAEAVAPESESVLSPPLRSKPPIGQNIPGMLPLSSPPLGPSSLLTQPLYRNCAVSAVAPLQPQLISNGSRRSTLGRSHDFTDISSAGISDTETWSHSHNQGYMSDNPMLDAASEAEQLRLVGKRLEADLYRSTSSLSKSPRKNRSRSRNRGTVNNEFSSSISRFDLAQLYDGLHPPTQMQTSRLSSSLHLLPTRPPYTPPSTPNSLLSANRCSQHSVDLSASNGQSVPRLRSFLDHFKSPTSAEDSENYIYMDEDVRARRVNAQAVNVISPVSF